MVRAWPASRSLIALEKLRPLARYQSKPSVHALGQDFLSNARHESRRRKGERSQGNR